MINIINSIDLSELLKSLVVDIKANWKDPFKSPVVIFPNSKLEQWFKYNWLKDSSNGVLMNLEYTRMESFLYECVGSTGYCLQKELLRDLLIAKLEAKVNSQYYFETLQSDYVTNYLKEGDSVNEVHLFDFASQMADLFIDYEVDVFDWSSSNQNPAWEKNLYDDTLGKGITLTLPSQEGAEAKEVEYKTLYEAYNLGNFTLPAKYQGRPIFVFGFSGMGRIHRDIIKKIAAQNTVNVYLQYDDKADVPNADWMQNGKAEFDEWQPVTPTTLTSSKALPNFFLASAPSKLREVEVLHSEICKLINDKDVKPSDILVVAPNISDYSAEIEHIFEHNTDPNLPYVLADGSSKNSQVAAAFDVLVNMLFNGGLNRADLFKLLRNPVVQVARGLNDDEVSSWLTWVESMNVFRSNGVIDDWEKAKRRLLTARLTDEKFTDNNLSTYLPYEDMNTQSNSSLSKFVKAIDDARSWCDLAKKSRVADVDIETVENLLSSFLHMDGILEEELECERFVYAGVRSALYQQRMLLNAGVQLSLPFRCFMLALQEAIQEVGVVKGLAYIDGVTFTSMKPNRVMTADYVFMLGMDSKSFPGVQNLNVLDVRKPKGDDKQLPAQNKNTFLCQLMATGKELHISYVNRDLQKDDVFYPASVVSELNIPNSVNYGIDENRPNSELFTSRSQRNKEVYKRLNSSNSSSSAVTSPTVTPNANASAAQDRVSLSNLRSFLEDPFEAYVNRMLGTNEDDDDAEVENTEFEPIVIENKILKSRLRKEYIRKKIENIDNQQVIDNYKQDLVKTLLDEGAFRDEKLAQMVVEELSEEGDNLFGLIKQMELPLSNMIFDDNIDLQLKTENKDWLLSGTTTWHVWPSDNELHVIEIYFGYNLMMAYVTALAIIASKSQVNKKITVTLHSIANKRPTEISDSFKISPEEAKKLLEDIYNHAYLQNYHNCVFVNDVLYGHPYGYYGDFLNGLFGIQGKWNYFTHKSLIDIDCDLEYNRPDFVSLYEKAIKSQRKLICFVDSNAPFKRK